MTELLITALIILGVYLFVVDSWFSYIAVMRLRDLKSQLGPAAKVFAYTGLGLAYIKDAGLVVIFSVLFLTLPREFTLTAMLKRLQLTDEGRWRGTAAQWVCAKLLNQFSGTPHC
jgi:hypothetical protein